MNKTLINFYYNGDDDYTLMYEAPQNEIIIELNRIKEYINDNCMKEDYEGLSDIEVYERELGKKFKEVGDYNVVDFNY
jgi:hypothetical protein